MTGHLGYLSTSVFNYLGIKYSSRHLKIAHATFPGPALQSAHRNPRMWMFLTSPAHRTGIVTEFELETVPVGQIWYQAHLYAPSENGKLLKAVREYQVAAEDDDHASIAFSLSYDHTFVAFVYSKPIERPAVFGMFYNIPFQKCFIESSIGTQYSLALAFTSVLGDGPPLK